MRSLGKKPHLWPSQRLKKRTGSLRCMHKGPKCIQSLWDHPKKIPFVQKHKEGAICAILRKKIPFLGHSQRPKKVLLTAQGCASLRTGPIIMQIPRGYQKKSLLCRKARNVRSLGKKPHFWPSQRLKKRTGTLSCMHKGPKCIQSLWDHQKIIPFVQKHKEGAICAILRKKIPFWGHSQRLKKVLLTAQGCARLRKAAHWPNNNANPSGLSEKKVYCVERRDMCDP